MMSKERPANMPSSARQCETCGEWIRIPVERKGGKIICAECFGESGSTFGGHSLDVGASHDRGYHGGRFHEGEW